MLQTRNHQDAIQYTNKPWHDRKELPATKCNQQPYGHKNSQFAPLRHSSQAKLETRDSKVTNGSQRPSGVTDMYFQLYRATYLSTELLHQL